MTELFLFAIIVILLGVFFTKKGKSFISNLFSEESILLILGSGVLYFLDTATRTFSIPDHSVAGRTFISIVMIANWIILRLLRKSTFTRGQRFIILLLMLLAECLTAFTIILYIPNPPSDNYVFKG